MASLTNDQNNQVDAKGAGVKPQDPKKEQAQQAKEERVQDQQIEQVLYELEAELQRSLGIKQNNTPQSQQNQETPITLALQGQEPSAMLNLQNSAQTLFSQTNDPNALLSFVKPDGQFNQQALLAVVTVARQNEPLHHHKMEMMEQFVKALTYTNRASSREVKNKEEERVSQIILEIIQDKKQQEMDEVAKENLEKLNANQTTAKGDLLEKNKTETERKELIGKVEGEVTVAAKDLAKLEIEQVVRGVIVPEVEAQQDKLKANIQVATTRLDLLPDLERRLETAQVAAIQEKEVLAAGSDRLAKLAYEVRVGEQLGLPPSQYADAKSKFDKLSSYLHARFDQQGIGTQLNQVVDAAQKHGDHSALVVRYRSEGVTSLTQRVQGKSNGLVHENAGRVAGVISDLNQVEMKYVSLYMKATNSDGKGLEEFVQTRFKTNVSQGLEAVQKRLAVKADIATGLTGEDCAKALGINAKSREIIVSGSDQDKIALGMLHALSRKDGASAFQDLLTKVSKDEVETSFTKLTGKSVTDYAASHSANHPQLVTEAELSLCMFQGKDPIELINKRLALAATDLGAAKANISSNQAAEKVAAEEYHQAHERLLKLASSLGINVDRVVSLEALNQGINQQAQTLALIAYKGMERDYQFDIKLHETDSHDATVRQRAAANQQAVSELYKVEKEKYLKKFEQLGFISAESHILLTSGKTPEQLDQNSQVLVTIRRQAVEEARAESADILQRVRTIHTAADYSISFTDSARDKVWGAMSSGDFNPLEGRKLQALSTKYKEETGDNLSKVSGCFSEGGERGCFVAYLRGDRSKVIAERMLGLMKHDAYWNEPDRGTIRRITTIYASSDEAFKKQVDAHIAARDSKMAPSRSGMVNVGSRTFTELVKANGSGLREELVQTLNNTTLSVATAKAMEINQRFVHWHGDDYEGIAKELESYLGKAFDPKRPIAEQLQEEGFDKDKIDKFKQAWHDLYGKDIIEHLASRDSKRYWIATVSTLGIYAGYKGVSNSWTGNTDADRVWLRGIVNNDQVLADTGKFIYAAQQDKVSLGLTAIERQIYIPKDTSNKSSPIDTTQVNKLDYILAIQDEEQRNKYLGIYYQHRDAHLAKVDEKLGGKLATIWKYKSTQENSNIINYALTNRDWLEKVPTQNGGQVFFNTHNTFNSMVRVHEAGLNKTASTEEKAMLFEVKDLSNFELHRLNAMHTKIVGVTLEKAFEEEMGGFWAGNDYDKAVLYLEGRPVYDGSKQSLDAYINWQKRRREVEDQGWLTGTAEHKWYIKVGTLGLSELPKLGFTTEARKRMEASEDRLVKEYIEATKNGTIGSLEKRNELAALAKGMEATCDRYAERYEELVDNSIVVAEVGTGIVVGVVTLGSGSAVSVALLTKAGVAAAGASLLTRTVVRTAAYGAYGGETFADDSKHAIATGVTTVVAVGATQGVRTIAGKILEVVEDNTGSLLSAASRQGSADIIGNTSGELIRSGRNATALAISGDSTAANCFIETAQQLQTAGKIKIAAGILDNGALSQAQKVQQIVDGLGARHLNRVLGKMSEEVISPDFISNVARNAARSPEMTETMTKLFGSAQSQWESEMLKLGGDGLRQRLITAGFSERSLGELTTSAKGLYSAGVRSYYDNWVTHQTNFFVRTSLRAGESGLSGATAGGTYGMTAAALDPYTWKNGDISGVLNSGWHGAKWGGGLGFAVGGVSSLASEPGRYLRHRTISRVEIENNFLNNPAYDQAFLKNALGSIEGDLPIAIVRMARDKVVTPVGLADHIKAWRPGESITKPFKDWWTQKTFSPRQQYLFDPTEKQQAARNIIQASNEGAAVAPKDVKALFGGGTEGSWTQRGTWDTSSRLTHYGRQAKVGLKATWENFDVNNIGFKPNPSQIDTYYALAAKTGAAPGSAAAGQAKLSLFDINCLSGGSNSRYLGYYKLNPNAPVFTHASQSPSYRIAEAFPDIAVDGFSKFSYAQYLDNTCGNTTLIFANAGNLRALSVEAQLRRATTWAQTTVMAASSLVSFSSGSLADDAANPFAKGLPSEPTPIVHVEKSSDFYKSDAQKFFDSQQQKAPAAIAAQKVETQGSAKAVQNVTEEVSVTTKVDRIYNEANGQVKFSDILKEEAAKKPTVQTQVVHQEQQVNKFELRNLGNDQIRQQVIRSEQEVIKIASEYHQLERILQQREHAQIASQNRQKQDRKKKKDEEEYDDNGSGRKKREINSDDGKKNEEDTPIQVSESPIMRALAFSDEMQRRRDWKRDQSRKLVTVKDAEGNERQEYVWVEEVSDVDISDVVRKIT